MRGSLLVLCILAGLATVRAKPSAAGLQDALAAAAALCPASASNTSDLPLPSTLQAAIRGQVLTCSQTRAPFLSAIALFEPSAYPHDADALPAFVVQPVGKSQETYCSGVIFTPAGQGTAYCCSAGVHVCKHISASNNHHHSEHTLGLNPQEQRMLHRLSSLLQHTTLHWL